MHKPNKLTPVISITTANSKSLRSFINRNARIQGGAVLVIRPQQPEQYRISPNGPDAA